MVYGMPTRRVGQSRTGAGPVRVEREPMIREPMIREPMISERVGATE